MPKTVCGPHSGSRGLGSRPVKQLSCVLGQGAFLFSASPWSINELRLALREA